jgi:signal transduction histidine kinase/HPt (histidine-containing phosphotransfer) domain-containing protein/ActR/RegA family two-component response regulator
MMPSLSTELFQLLGYALCEDRGDRQFALLYDPPEWFREVWGPDVRAGEVLALADRSPFLEAFLTDAEEYWSSDATSPLESGAWIEQAASDREIPLEARAWRLDGRRILSIHSRQDEFRERTRVLQTARDSLLVHERLLKEIQKKEILLHCIIHDLSQPLTAMRGCFDVLEQETLPPTSKRLIELGRQQSERQDSMIREVLQAFAMDIEAATRAGESGQAPPSLLACSEETVAAFGPVFQSHGAAIRVDPQLDRSANWNVAGEKSHLMRVFSNLVENALRHAPKGTTVTIGLEDDGGEAKAVVDDEGPGLPKEFKPSEAFALFSKGKEGGGKAGLGLYFCRITVERWGGSIGCESLPERGARFWFRLPRATRAAETPPDRASSQSPAVKPARASGQNDSPRISLDILLAEDDPAIREVTKALLQREGHRAVAVTSGLEALRALAKRRFDLVLLDEEMPGMTGVEAVEAIRAHESRNSGHQKIFAISGNATEEDRARLLAAGFDACFSKPFRVAELAKGLTRFFPGTDPLVHEKEDKPIPPLPDSEASLLARFGGDAKLLRGVSKTFLKDYPAKLRIIKQAIARKNAATLASAAHALKGAVAIFGAADAVQSALDLQQMGRQGSLAPAPTAVRKLDEALARLDAKLREYAAPSSRSPSRSGRGKTAARKPQRRAKRLPRRPR